jgi:hypothetical protein
LTSDREDYTLCNHTYTKERLSHIRDRTDMTDMTLEARRRILCTVVFQPLRNGCAPASEA